MARLTKNAPKTYVAVNGFSGLRESPDGDTGLQWGEAAVMRNFCITEAGHLQIRPGTREMLTLAQGQPVRGIYSGPVNGTDCLIAACGGHIWQLTQTEDGFTKADLGEADDAPMHFFPFDNKLYALNGTAYLVWDGEGQFGPVGGYVPLVAVATPPEGGGTLLEPVNKLTGQKRQRFSPDGTGTVFQLGETEIDSVEAVVSRDGSTLSSWTVDLEQGTVTFSTAPPKGVDALEIQWAKGTGDRAAVTGMRFSEAYNGTADTRVFLYGDGTNRLLYSDLDENGRPRADYFPDLNVLHVDEGETKVTGLLRHFDKLMAFKEDGAFQISYDTIPLEDGSVTAAFYVMPVNRTIGNEAPGQALLVGNWPRTLFGGGVYTWSTGESVRDDRLASRISQRVAKTLSGFDFTKVYCFDDPISQTYFIFHQNQWLCHHYGRDAWSYHEGPAVTAAVRWDGKLYFGTASGALLHSARAYRNDSGTEIDAYFESGSMDFDSGHLKKYVSHIFLSMQPESNARISMAVRSNRGAYYVERQVAYSYWTFLHLDFAHLSFRTNRRPQMKKERFRVRQMTYFKLILESHSASATATILGAELAVQYGGTIR